MLAVGIATIAAAVGAGGLGEFIFRGVASVDNRLVLAGAIPAALLAIAADTGLGWVESRLQSAGSGTHVIMRFCSPVFCSLAIAACAPPRPDYPVIGAKNFTEQVVLGELLAQHIEAGPA